MLDAPDLGFLQWAGTMLNNKDDVGPARGRFTPNASFAGGLAAGPVVLFDATGAASVVLSPSSQFMAVSAAPATPANASLAWGPLGSAAAVPAGFGYSVVAWGGAGINSNVMAWGAALLARHGKPHGLSKVDFTNTHLGYNTDNGK